jgi:N-acetylmuramoyl-L-alanine amidase
MAVFASAGHNTQGIKKDPGAVANGYIEAELNVQFRDLFVQECKALGMKVIQDLDSETLGQYLARIKTGSGSVVIEFHFDAAANDTVSGTTGLIEAEADRLDNAFAVEVTGTVSRITGIPNRGVRTEKESHRGSLGLMREEGIICLVELGFITNKDDVKKHINVRPLLAKELALIAKKFEDMI